MAGSPEDEAGPAVSSSLKCAVTNVRDNKMKEQLCFLRSSGKS